MSSSEVARSTCVLFASLLCWLLLRLPAALVTACALCVVPLLPRGQQPRASVAVNKPQEEVVEPPAALISPSVCCQTQPSSGDCACAAPASGAPPQRVLRAYYASQSGASRGYAQRCASRALSRGVRLEVLDAGDCGEPESLAGCDVALVFASTHAGGVAPERCRFFTDWFQDAAVDERVGKGFLSGTSFAVFGAGNAAYGPAHFNAVARRLDASLATLGARRLAPLGCADEDAGDTAPQFDAWCDALLPLLALDADAGRPADDGAASDSSASSYVDSDDQGEEDPADSDDQGSEADLDIEDIGGAVPRPPTARVRKGRPPPGAPPAAAAPAALKEMVTPKVRASLTKQGYKVIGSHSGVKLCRWTKSMLRGRGGCYKFAFYGIESHRCMEATPSLACANKCTFCWRHHSNPVGTEWKWVMDPPDMIVTQALGEHAAMIKQMLGVPGVLPGRIEEGMAPRHCALSLVGEPIMYPRINELVGELHGRGISTFLVTNAQFPEAIRALRPVTQLYVSVDAATPETLKAIDRPLFSDFWERFTASLRALRDKSQRTVYRLTLVAGYNITDADGYAALVELGCPDLIEIKGVTFCGAGSGASALTMANVPYHADVLAFANALAAAVAKRGGGDYGLACEHAHSCCTLLARRDKFWRDGRWHTHIDYPRFNSLQASGQPFSATDYCLPTPGWAVAGASEGGFDPEQTRFRKERNHPGKAEGAGRE